MEINSDIGSKDVKYLQIQIRDLEQRLAEAEARIQILTEARSGEAGPIYDSSDKAVRTTGNPFDIREHKGAETELEQSKSVLAQAGKMAQLGAWDIEFNNYANLNANPLRWSDEVYRILGYIPGEVEASNDLFFERVHPEDRQRVRDAVSQALAEKQPYEVEHRIIRPDGSERIVYEHAQIVFDIQGQPVCMIGAVQDITDRKRAEQALRASEAQFRQLADSMPQLVWTAGPDGRVDYYNRRYQEYNGIAPLEGKAWQWSPVLHPDDLQSTVESWMRSLETGETYQCEHRVQMADGSYRWHLSRGVPVKDEKGRIVRWYGTATDIHERKRSEEELRNRNERLALLSDAAGELLQTLDPGSLLDRLFQRLSGLLSLEVYVHYRLSEDGTHMNLGALSGFPAKVQKKLERLDLGQAVCGTVAATQQRMVVEDVLSSVDERAELIRSLGISAYVCYPLVARGKLIGTLSFGTRSRTHFEPEALDLLQAASNLVAAAIDRNQDEVALQAYAKRLEASNRDLQEFAFVASHDLQEPLRKIEAFGDSLLQKSSNLDERQREQLVRMRKAAERMRSMVDGLLQLSRLSTQAQPFERVDLSRLVAEVLSDLDMHIRHARGTVELEDLPIIEADPLQMRQLFQNLIGNAIKFRSPGGKPWVRVYAKGPSEGFVDIRVEDNGIGFEEEYAVRMFQPFQRLVGRSEFEGSGMGLAICRRIIERHGGEIKARSKKGQGATFIISLPVRHPSQNTEGFDP